ncbi:MAG: hypothetical protein GXO89_13645, partial [Chlorobi bacterium]|nr:hypothetical protein [Chlorobiota bacterium]
MPDIYSSIVGSQKFLRSYYGISQWYFGGGNRISVFSRKPKKPFEEIKSIYLSKAKALKVSGTHTTGISREQSKRIKEQIRKEIRIEEINSLKKRGFILILSIAILLGLYYLTIYLIGIIATAFS